MKSLVKQSVNTIVGLIVNAFLTMLATKVIDHIYNKFIKKNMCVLCGGRGWRWKRESPAEEAVKVQCDCSKSKKMSWLDMFKWEIE